MYTGMADMVGTPGMWPGPAPARCSMLPAGTRVGWPCMARCIGLLGTALTVLPTALLPLERLVSWGVALVLALALVELDVRVTGTCWGAESAVLPVLMTPELRRVAVLPAPAAFVPVVLPLPVVAVELPELGPLLAAVGFALPPLPLPPPELLLPALPCRLRPAPRPPAAAMPPPRPAPPVTAWQCTFSSDSALTRTVQHPPSAALSNIECESQVNLMASKR